MTTDTGGTMPTPTPAERPESHTCPDCGRPITLQPSGWWSHDGMPNGCWRLSMDGPEEASDDDNA